jgi:hypothetical protein
VSVEPTLETVTFETFGPWWRAEFWRIIRQFFNLLNAGIQWNILRLKANLRGMARED